MVYKTRYRGKMRAQTFLGHVASKPVNARKHSPTRSIPPKCKTPRMENEMAYSPSLLSPAGTALGRDGEGPADGGEAGFSVSMFASRLTGKLVYEFSTMRALTRSWKCGDGGAMKHNIPESIRVRRAVTVWRGASSR